jgi:NADH dehydrogenase
VNEREAHGGTLVLGGGFAGSFVARLLGKIWLRYERLVAALGAVSRVLPIPGLADYGLGFKTLADAINLRNHVLRRLEAAVAAPSAGQRRRELTFVFILGT